MDETINTKETDKDTEKKSTAKTKSFKPMDTVTCQSVTSGLLLMVGKKTGLLYRWENYNDMAEVEYQDILALKYTRSDYLYKPYFLIQNRTILESPSWEDIRVITDKAYGLDNLEIFLKMDIQELTRRILLLPDGLKKSLAAFAAEKISIGELDSLNKIKALDQALGTDFMANFS